MDNLEILEVKALEDRRKYVLIANFVDGFALGWKMAVSEAFKDALDIKLTPIKITEEGKTVTRSTEGHICDFQKGDATMRWTQGDIYNFQEGDVIYDTREAYQEWGKALKHITLGIQIESASPCSRVIYDTYTSKNNKLELTNQKEGKYPQDKTFDSLIIKKQRLKLGSVKFKVHRPNKERTALQESEYIEYIKCTQEEFVVFLQTGKIKGKIKTLQGKEIQVIDWDLFEENNH